MNRTIYTPLQKYMVRRAVNAPRQRLSTSMTAVVPASVEDSSNVSCSSLLRPQSPSARNNDVGSVYTPLQLYNSNNRRHSVTAASSSSSNIYHYKPTVASRRTYSTLPNKTFLSSPPSPSRVGATTDSRSVRQMATIDHPYFTNGYSNPYNNVLLRLSTDDNVRFHDEIKISATSSYGGFLYDDQMTSPSLQDNKVLSYSQIERLANLECL